MGPERLRRVLPTTAYYRGSRESWAQDDFLKKLTPKANAIPNGAEVVHGRDRNEPFNPGSCEGLEPYRVPRIDQAMTHRLNVWRQRGDSFGNSGGAHSERH